MNYKISNTDKRVKVYRQELTENLSKDKVSNRWLKSCALSIVKEKLNI